MLGSRMEKEGNRTLTSEARLCYVCSGNVERLVECSAKCHQASSPMALQVPFSVGHSPFITDAKERLVVGICRDIRANPLGTQAGVRV